jgi:16S rRNA (uracil1498-N3)-methyltransferase
LIPIATERSVVEPGTSKLSRLRRSIIEASKQCGRNRLMVLESPVHWEALIGSWHESWKFLADPEGTPARRGLTISRGGSAILAIGPEGGFTARERDLALQAGWSAITLSVNTLRIETAAVAGCAILFTRSQEPKK